MSIDCEKSGRMMSFPAWWVIETLVPRVYLLTAVMTSVKYCKTTQQHSISDKQTVTLTVLHALSSPF